MQVNLLSVYSQHKFYTIKSLSSYSLVAGADHGFESHTQPNFCDAHGGDTLNKFDRLTLLSWVKTFFSIYNSPITLLNILMDNNKKKCILISANYKM